MDDELMNQRTAETGGDGEVEGCAYRQHGAKQGEGTYLKNPP